MKRYVYRIGESTDPQIVGGKGASLSVMRQLGLRVPPGLTLSTEAWRAWKAGEVRIGTLLKDHVGPLLKELFPEFGHGQAVSVRSGAAQSMPGMMDTVLNVGAQDYLGRLAYLTSLMRASGQDMSAVDEIIAKYLVERQAFFLTADNVSTKLVKQIEPLAGEGAQGTLAFQLAWAIKLVFESWDSEKARLYRQVAHIPEDAGTACTIQLMVNGLEGYTGVMLTRGLENGYPQIDWLPHALGSDVVDGTHPTYSVDQFREMHSADFRTLLKAGQQLEKVYHDAMDLEFTHDDDELYILQCRVAKRTPAEEMRLAVQLYDEGIISADRVLATKMVDDSREVVKVDGHALLALGHIIAPKLVTGRLNIKPNEFKPGMIALRYMTTTDDLDVMLKSSAVLTIQGGPTCHASLVAHEFNLTTVVGVGGVFDHHRFAPGKPIEYAWYTSPESESHWVVEGEPVTVLPDGRVYLGEVEPQVERQPGQWSAKLKTLKAKVRRERSKAKKQAEQSGVDEPAGGEEIPF